MLGEAQTKGKKMKNRVMWAVALVVLVVMFLLACPSAKAAEWEIGVRAPIAQGIVDDYKSAPRGDLGQGFVGSINLWDPQGPMVPDLFIGVITEDKKWGLELSCPQRSWVAANRYPGDRTRDGEFVMTSPTVSAIRRFPLKRAAFYAGAEVSYNFINVLEDAWWKEGNSSQEDYDANGPNPVKRRQMSAKNVLGLGAFLGGEAPIAKFGKYVLLLDVRAGYKKLADSDVNFQLFANDRMTADRGPFSIDFSRWDATVGAKVRF
jgi:hypothetical protein